MTQEEKAKAYDEALDRAKEFHKSKEGIYVLAAETIFPELRESEDERIGKCINMALTDVEERLKDCLAYLEKQKEPHFTKRNALFDKCVENCDPEIMKRVSDEVDAMLEKEQKPDTRDSDDLQLLGFIYDLLNEIEWNDNWAMSKDECLRRLNNYRPQKPTEWSEEDEDMLNSCISSIEEAKENRYAYKETDGDTSYDHEIAWLKSLRSHPKSSDNSRN